MGRSDLNLSKTMGGCCLVYLVLSIPAFLITGNGIQIFMVWNLFLAYLPLVLAEMVHTNLERAKPSMALVLGLAWLLFFPNAPYMVTDFIHVSRTEFYTQANGYAPVVYSTDLRSWVKLIHIGLGALLGTLIGLLSLYLMHQVISARKNRFLAHGFVAGVCLLSGYAIYIGRFLRVNSWDILRPVSLLSRLVTDFGPFAVNFSLLFAGYVMASYWVFYLLISAKID